MGIAAILPPGPSLVAGQERFLTTTELRGVGVLSCYKKQLYCYVKPPHTVKTDGLLSPAKAPADRVSHYFDRYETKDPAVVVAQLEASAPGRSRSISCLTEPVGKVHNPKLQSWVHASDLFAIDYLGLLWDKKITNLYQVNGKDITEVEIGELAREERKSIDWGASRPDDPFHFKHIQHYFLCVEDGVVPPEYLHRVPQPDDRRTYVVRNALKMGFGGHYDEAKARFRLHEAETFEDGDAVVESDKNSHLTFGEVKELMKLYTVDPNNSSGKVPPFLTITSSDKEEYVMFGSFDIAFPLDTKGQKDRANAIAAHLGIPKEQIDFAKESLPPPVFRPSTMRNLFASAPEPAAEVATEAEKLKGNPGARKKIEARILEVVKVMEPGGTNAARLKTVFAEMSDSQFHEYMLNLKAGRDQLYILAPNMKVTLRTEDLLKAARLVKSRIFHRLWITDPVSKRRFLTQHEYPVYRLPIRRAQQFLDKKISLGKADNRIDALTGTVTGEDRASGISAPEIHILRTRGLSATMLELLKVRGGDVHANGEFKRKLEEAGEVSLTDLTGDSRARSVTVARLLFRAVHLDTNL